MTPNAANEGYLQTKVDRMGHELSGSGVAVSTGVGDIARQRDTAPAAVEVPHRQGVGMAPRPDDDQHDVPPGGAGPAHDREEIA